MRTQGSLEKKPVGKSGLLEGAGRTWQRMAAGDCGPDSN